MGSDTRGWGRTQEGGVRVQEGGVGHKRVGSGHERPNCCQEQSCYVGGMLSCGFQDTARLPSVRHLAGKPNSNTNICVRI